MTLTPRWAEVWIDGAPFGDAPLVDQPIALGVHDVRFLGYRDGELTVSHGLRRDISRVIRQVRPQRVLTQSPERWWERVGASHPDHRAAGDATMDAVYPDARNPFAHIPLLEDEGLEPWTVPEVWLMASPRGEHVVDAYECPVLPGTRTLEWVLADPAGQDRDVVRVVRDQIREHVVALIREISPECC